MSENAHNEETFEAQYEKLEAIVNKLETESLDLETTLKLFEEGNALAEKCGKLLESAELKLKDLRDAQSADQE